MARLEGRHPAGVAGEWFVDTHCMDCDAARQVAPGLIARNPGDGVSVFARQPHTPEEIEMAWRAVMVCPTRSVGRVTLRRPDSLVFPDDLGDGVHRVGHNSTSSFGAHSYLARRPGGNLMFDAPWWAREVAGPVEGLGGLAHILLSHRDDVAEADRYAERFGARVWIHVDDREAAPYATDLIDGTSISTVAGDVVAFPVPGHTRGSVLNLVDGHLLFSGDSLSWNPWDERLHAFRRACWYSWREQTAALGRSAYSGRRFDRLFCGHGWSHDFAAEAFHTQLVELVALMPAM